MVRRICAHGSRATATMSCAGILRERLLLPSNATCPRAAYPTRLQTEVAMSLLPIFLKLEGRPGLLVGAGNVALEKINSLLVTGLRLRVVAPEASAEIRHLADEGRLEWFDRKFDPTDLDGN